MVRLERGCRPNRWRRFVKRRARAGRKLLQVRLQRGTRGLRRAIRHRAAFVLLSQVGRERELHSSSGANVISCFEYVALVRDALRHCDANEERRRCSRCRCRGLAGLDRCAGRRSGRGWRGLGRGGVVGPIGGGVRELAAEALNMTLAALQPLLRLGERVVAAAVHDAMKAVLLREVRVERGRHLYIEFVVILINGSRVLVCKRRAVVLGAPARGHAGIEQGRRRRHWTRRLRRPRLLCRRHTGAGRKVLS